jgi:hypothetical protein
VYLRGDHCQRNLLTCSLEEFPPDLPSTVEDTSDSDGIGFDPIEVDVLFNAEAAKAGSEVVSRSPHRRKGE